MRQPYRFTHRKGRAIQVMFAHIPGSWFSTGTDDMIEAVRYAEKELTKDVLQVKGHIPTLREFSEGIFSIGDPLGYRKRNLKRNYEYDDNFYDAHQGRLVNYILPQFGDYLIDSITDVAIEDWLLDLESYRSDGELSDATKNKILQCMRIIFQEAKRAGYISVNPAKDVMMINAQHEVRNPFTQEELVKLFPTDERELLRIWGKRMWAVYFLIMRDTGFRPGEVAGLTRSCYVPQYRGVYSEKSVSYYTRAMKDSIKTTKKGQKYKVGILTTQTVCQLEKLLVENKEDHLFQIKGRLIVPDIANKHLRLSVRKAKVDLMGRTQYSLRHSFETDVSGKVENKILLELMAHTTYRKEYDHRTPEQILERLQPIRAILEERRDGKER